jgi:hypothetical protein
MAVVEIDGTGSDTSCHSRLKNWVATYGMIAHDMPYRGPTLVLRHGDPVANADRMLAFCGLRQ